MKWSFSKGLIIKGEIKMIGNIGDFIGQKVRVVVFNKQNEPEIDLICKEFSKDIAALFDNYKFLDYHITSLTQLNVIELVKE